MEFGELRFESDKLEKGDLDTHVSGAFILNAPLGSLIALRAKIQDVFERGLIFYTMSSQNLYVVNWNDLSADKQRKLKGGF